MLSILPTAVLTAFIVAVASIPGIIRVAQRMNFFDIPDARKNHDRRVPLLGGLAIFAAMIFSFTLWAAPYFSPSHVLIIAALLVLFFLGLRDDILPLAPFTKIAGQLVASLIVVMFCGIRLSGLYGLLGIHSLTPLISISLSVLVMLFLINAYNLIDGADGLAAGLGCIASLVLGYLFYQYKDMLMSVLAFSMSGALLGFLVFNLAPARIFMGDTGSMIIGFTLGLLSIRFAELTREEINGILHYQATPVVLLSLWIIPAVDALRVFLLRIFQKRSPFKADRLHIHHQLFKLGMSHKQVSLILWMSSFSFLVLAVLLLERMQASYVFYLLLSLALILMTLPHFLLKWRKNKQLA